MNVLIGGMEDGEPQLYWMDYLGTLARVTKGAHGYAAYFVSSVLENAYKEGMTIEEGIEALKKCVVELKTRFLIDQSNFKVKIITDEGIEVRDLE